MTRTFMLRLLGVLGLALGLALTATAGSASAQMAMGGPYAPVSATADAPGSQIQAQAGVTLPDLQIQNGPQAGDVSTQGVSAAACGFFIDLSDHHYAKYGHCGSAWSIKIRVNDMYGADSRDIWVGRGVTNLSTDWRLDDFWFITNAWCIQNCY